MVRFGLAAGRFCDLHHLYFSFLIQIYHVPTSSTIDIQASAEIDVLGEYQLPLFALFFSSRLEREILPYTYNFNFNLNRFTSIQLQHNEILMVVYTNCFLTYSFNYRSSFRKSQQGCFPMALTTISGSIALLSQDSFNLSQNWAIFASVLWWISGVIGLMTAALVPFSMMSYQTHHFSGTTAALLLPIVPPITTAAVGGTLTEIFASSHPTYAFTILIWSYCVLGVGLPLALLILVLYFQRLMLFRAPSRDIIISVFLPLGPCGQGGEALLHLGRSSLKLYPIIHEKFGNQTGVEDLDKFFAYGMFASGLVSGLLLWGLGAWWSVIGLMTVIRERRAGRLPFNMGVSMISNDKSKVVARN